MNGTIIRDHRIVKQSHRLLSGFVWTHLSFQSAEDFFRQNLNSNDLTII
jgi:hypothetical protein